jgi:hypothetical protein
MISCSARHAIAVLVGGSRRLVEDIDLRRNLKLESGGTHANVVTWRALGGYRLDVQDLAAGLGT